MTHTTYAGLIRPSTGRKALTYDAMLVIGGSILLALLAQLSVPVPFSPVPITGQTFGVILIGALLGSRRGALAMVAYLTEGAAGLPVFAGGGFGFAHLLGPTGGYLFGFITGAFMTGFLAERGWDRKIALSIVAMTAGTIVIFAFGVGWLSVTVGVERALQLGFYPFVMGAGAKIALASALLPVGWRFIRRS